MLKIVGDICLTDGYFDVGFGIGSKLRWGFDPFGRLARNSEDCWIGNFEGVVSETSVLSGRVSKQFRVDPAALTHLQHFDYYGVANNHVMQHGVVAYNRTVEVLESLGAHCFGSNEVKSRVFEHQGRTVSITGFSQRMDQFSDLPGYWHCPEYSEISAEIVSLPVDAFKIAFVHWGNEFINYPSLRQKKFAHWLIDSGFDLVVGMHPHVMQGCEVYNGKCIFYSIGNFVFDMAWSATHYGVIISVDLALETPVIKYEYIRVGKDYSPYLVNEDDVPGQFRFETLNMFLSKEENSEEYHSVIQRFYHQYRKANHKDILRKILKHPAVAAGIIMDYIKRRLKYVPSNND